MMRRAILKQLQERQQKLFEERRPGNRLQARRYIQVIEAQDEVRRQSRTQNKKKRTTR
jgi:hypothetical protein